MVSRSLIRRALLLGIWVGGILLLLDIREPGFWREAVGVARQAVHDGEAGPNGAPIVAPAAPEVVASSLPAALAALPAATPAPAVLATPSPVALARAPGAATTQRHATAAHGAGVAGRNVPSGDLYARVDAAWQLDGRGEYAAAWRIARTLPEDGRDPQILRLKASTALWAHDNEEALRLATRWQQRDPAAVEARLVLAQAQLQSGRIAAARVVIDGLAHAPLDAEHALQLAILQDWAGDRSGAIASLRAVLARRGDDPEALRRLARLLETDGQDAEARTTIARARRAAPDDAALELLAAHVAAKLGDREAADDGYASYVERHPDDVDGRLEAARHAVNAGAPEAAIDGYRAVIERRGPEGLRVELARALLAAGRYTEAEPVARAAVASPEDGPEARLALAQSVYLQGRPRDAAPLFADARDSATHTPVDATFRARLALAQDHDLEAYGLLGDQLAGEAPPEPTSAASPAELWLLLGNVAQKRGDYRAAREAYARAGELGAPLRAAIASEALDAASGPHAGVGYAFFADANRLEVNGGAMWGEFRPGDVALVRIQTLAQVVSQDDARYTRTGGSVAVRELYVTPEWALDGSIGFINSSAGGGNLVEGSLGARRYSTDGSVLGLAGYREPLLGGHEDLDPRLWNRIIDLKALGPSFAINGGKVFGDWLLSEERRDRLWAQLGAENYQDGNLRGIFYAHYQLPLRNGPDDWTVLRPNAYFEAFKDAHVPDYFSPSTHATIGVAGHTVQQRGRLRFEAELNPQLVVTDGRAGFGAHALLDASMQLGPASVGISGFAFYDSEDAYWLARAMAHVEVAF